MRHSEPTLIPSQPNFERRSRIATRRSCAPLPKQNRHGFPNDGANSLPNAPKWLLKPRQLCQQNQCFEYGWGGRDRTSEWRNQNPLPYRLATPHQACRIGLARKRHAIPGRRPWSTDRARPFQPPRRRNFAAPPGDPTFPPIRQCWQALIPPARSRRGGPPRACAKKLRPGRFHGMTAAKSANSTFEDTP